MGETLLHAGYVKGLTQQLDTVNVRIVRCTISALEQVQATIEQLPTAGERERAVFSSVHSGYMASGPGRHLGFRV